MARIFQFVVFVLVLASCTSENNFRIDGQLPDNSFNNEWVYLVPLQNAPVERVDSTQIINGTFVFEGKVDAPEIYIIRTRPYIRLALQELLVVKEPGQIYTYLGKTGKTKGTVLNDSLQVWKEQKELFEVKSNLLQQRYRKADENEKVDIKAQQVKLAEQKNSYHFKFAKNNKNNVVGAMVTRFTKASFSPQQKKELGIE